MHPGFDKDYRYLLSRLIPRHLLSSQRLEGILNALASNSRIEMVREAYLSLEELTARGIFRREYLRRKDSDAYISYSMKDNPSRITLVMSGGEYDSVSGGERKSTGILPSVLAGIISSLSLNDSAKRISARIEEILDMAGYIYRNSRCFLILLQESPSMVGKAGDRIKIASLSDISANRFYGPCLEGGSSHEFFRLRGVFPGKSLFSISSKARSVILIPLFSRNKKWGVIEVHLMDEKSPDNDMITNFFLLGQGVVRLIENNKHLENMVSVDRLTQINNRNYYESQLPLEMERATRTKNYLTFLMIDIDDFKKVNDMYGHDVGDCVLKLVAQAVKGHLRKIDLLFRYGGEEFIALLPGAGMEDAGRTAERIREVVSKTGHSIGDGREIKVTISIGGCIYPVDARNEAELFRRADRALYRSKRGGKNRVTFHATDPL